VLYALRKLIAFVFLGGMFWLIYHDPGNLYKPWFMHTLGLITIVFAFFWLLIPMIVVKLRIRRRIGQNKERYQKWLADGGVAAIRPRPARRVRLEPVDPEEQAFFHEKGTLYVAADEESGRAHSPSAPLVGSMASRPLGRPSDVAFPNHRSEGYVCQRTHCYFTNRRIAFTGKDLDVNIPLADLRKTVVEPGGIVFEAADAMRFAFTFQNPLIAADVMNHAKTCGLGQLSGMKCACVSTDETATDKGQDD